MIFDKSDDRKELIFLGMSESGFATGSRRYNLRIDKLNLTNTDADTFVDTMAVNLWKHTLSDNPLHSEVTSAKFDAYSKTEWDTKLYTRYILPVAMIKDVGGTNALTLVIPHLEVDLVSAA